MTTSLPGARASEDTEARAWLPALSLRNGALAIEHGTASGTRLGAAHRSLRRFSAWSIADRVDNPVVEAMSNLPKAIPAAIQRAGRSAERLAPRRRPGLLHRRSGGFL